MENREDYVHDNLLDRAVDALSRDPMPDELPPDQVAQLIAIVKRAADRPDSIPIMKKMKNWGSGIKITVAAAVSIAFVGLVTWLVSSSGASVTFDHFAKVFIKVRSATWKITSVFNGPQNETTTFSAIGMFLAPSHGRMESITNGQKQIDIFDGQKAKALSLLPETKMATIVELNNLPPETHFGRTFEDLQKIVADAKSGVAGKAERLGVEKIDGRRAEGFSILLDGMVVKIWADPKTLLPIRIEEDTTVGPNVHTEKTDFKFGIDLDESLFSVDVPDGYTTAQAIQFDLSKKPITYMAAILKMAAGFNDGVFPPKLLGDQGVQGIMQRRIITLAQEYGHNSPELLKLQTDFTMNLGGALALLYDLSPDAWHYAGKDVKLNTPNRPIFWFKFSEGANYQAIYADLSVKELSPGEVQKLPHSENNPNRDELFISPSALDGYATVEVIQPDPSKKPITCFVEILKMAAEFNEGVFPPALQGEHGVEGVMQRRIMTLANEHGQNSPDLMKIQTDIIKKLAEGFALLFAPPPDDWHYAGKDVKLNTPNRPIFWFKPSGDANYQVIYADLSVKEVPPGEAPKLPESENNTNRYK